MTTKIHIAKSGIPVKCPAKIACRLAPEICHFDKVEQAQEFADELNELKANNRSHLGLTSTDVSKLSNAELVYVSEKIQSEAEANENYKDYKGSVKWQKEVRSKASREMQKILEENNTMSNQIAGEIDNVDKLRQQWKKEKDPGQKRAYYNALKIARGSLNVLRDGYGPNLQANLKRFEELRNKKEIAEEKILDGLRKQALHSETKAILADVEAEIGERGAIKNAVPNQERFNRKAHEILTSENKALVEIGDVTNQEQLEEIEKVYDQKIAQLNNEMNNVYSEINNLRTEIGNISDEKDRLLEANPYPESEQLKVQEKHNFSQEEYDQYTALKQSPRHLLTTGINNPKLEKIIKEHALVEKFGPNKGMPKNRDLTEKDLNWINDYKNNPEMLKEHLDLINSNRAIIENNKYLQSKYEKYEDALWKSKNDYKTALTKDLDTLAKSHGDKSRELGHTYDKLRNLRDMRESNKRSAKQSLHEYEKLTNSNGGTPVNVKEFSTLSAPKDIGWRTENKPITLNKDSISTSSDGKINNVFVRPEGHDTPIYKVSKIEGESLVLENGNKMYPYRTLHRPRRGSLEYRYSNLEIIYGEKSGNNYNGPTEIGYGEYDSTD